ncbi:uncharacterized protein GGS25DRAFT_526529 [Hypoxylon fragiforme]|uniref:uncharacterized protein n=1 Tax=Hypoxylon fragiforme TaxID=63214 RepID=UPI0020C6ECC2|nr:uncharacterized protein GGS25DRAFT_526529 [Hypoxylon fragiforme]KAI2603491.1 hypothetical protein GGS25DRAFT_526529 [Hypoxylon fragiforme]
MANDTSSTGVFLGSCPSNPHMSSTATTTAHDESRLRDQRLSTVTQQSGTDHFTDRLVSLPATYDHEATMRSRLDTFSSQFASASTATGRANGN